MYDECDDMYSHDYNYDHYDPYDDEQEPCEEEWSEYDEESYYDEDCGGEGDYVSPSTSMPKESKRIRLDNEHDNASEVNETPTKVVDKEMDAIATEYELTKPKILEDSTTDPMPQPLADTLETWFWKRYNTEEIKKAQEKAHRCNNATALIPLKMEEEVFHALDARGKTIDARYRFIQNAMMKGCQPIANVWQKIITGITHMQRHRKDDNPFLNFTPDFAVDIMQIKA